MPIDFQPITERTTIDFQPLEVGPEVSGTSTITGRPIQREPKPGFISRISEDISQRAEKTKEMVERRTEKGLGETVFDLPGTLALTAGQVAGVGVDIIGEGIKNVYETLKPEDFELKEGIKQLYNTITPEDIKKGIAEKATEFLKSDIGKGAVAAISKGQEAYNNFAQKYPDSVMALEGIFNIAALGISKGVAQKTKEATDSVIKETLNIKGDVSTVLQKMRPNVVNARLDKELSNITKKGINKGIRPTVVGKRTFQQTAEYFTKAKEGVKTIIQNKNNLKLTNEVGEIVTGRLPKNLSQFSESIGQVKRSIFKQYDDLAKQAGGIKIETDSIARQLKRLANRKDIRVSAPGVSKYADDLAERLLQEKTYTILEAQDQIKTLNKLLESFYKNPSYDSAARAAIDDVLAKGLRKKIDKVISGFTGKDYQALKKQYGAVKALEKEVNHRMIVDLRRNTKGLIDFSDIFAGGQAVSSILAKDPAGFTGSVAIKGIANFYKRMNDPNKIIEKMFTKADRLVAAQTRLMNEFIPLSIPGRKVKQTMTDYERLKKLKTFNPENPLETF